MPALSIDLGDDYVGRPAGWGLAQHQGYTSQRYHKPADVYDPAWDLSGMLEQLGLLYQTGYGLADSDSWPAWKERQPFAAARAAERPLRVRSSRRRGPPTPAQRRGYTPSCPGRGQSPAPFYNKHAMHILIVDHSKVVRTVWNKMVADLGHQSLAVASAEDALDVMQGQEVEFICASLSLPGMNGIALCRQVRAMARHHKTPFILLTSTQDKTLRQEAFEAGVTEIQEKMDKEQLEARLKQYLSEEQRELTGRVLYIEDSMVAAHVMIKILRHMNLQVDHFPNADEALAAFEKHDYDLIVSDIILEGVMSGVGLVNRVRSYLSDKRRVPILALRAWTRPSRRIELFRLGVNDYIAKPPVEEEVRARVRNLIISKQLFDQVQEQSRQLYQLAMQDQLTGLYNRTGLMEFADKYFTEATTYDAPLSMLSSTWIISRTSTTPTATASATGAGSHQRHAEAGLPRG